MASWWWCLRHERVEPRKGCPAGDRLGPYATQEEAAQAIETARARTAALDAEAAAEDDWGSRPGGPAGPPGGPATGGG